MTKAFPKIAKCWKTVGNQLQKLRGYLTTYLTVESTPYFEDKTAYIPPSLAGPILSLGGGGPDVEEAIQWMINQVRGCTNCSTKIDVVVIRASGDYEYNRVISAMKGVKSVETLVISDRQQANRTEIVDKVKKAGVIFFAGGDQCKYIRNWKGTKLESAVQAVYAKGGGIGGTSAGAMIQSEYVYDACASSEKGIETRDALEDPYRDITFTYNLFKWPNLQGTIIDTHFDRRERMGRIMAFIARQIKDGVSRSVLGIAVSESTSVVIDKSGLAKVIGRGAVYLVLGDHMPEVCQPRTPLTFSNYKIWKLRSGETFNLKNPPKSGHYYRSVKRGRIDYNPY
ncbi:MAG: Type 1 glutamine amidotransferase-like domain-containing protein [Goleter apudmare HA4340-LM2]|jgi:cyanophycinase|nr:Type 1 glutamine amidotransferase-like domain-containing protein [Goleter apudmare HA4340-LM2]